MIYYASTTAIRNGDSCHFLPPPAQPSLHPVISNAVKKHIGCQSKD